MKFSGIDLHSNNSVVVVSDEEDRIVYQTLPNNLEQIRGIGAVCEELAGWCGVHVNGTFWWMDEDGGTGNWRTDGDQEIRGTEVQGDVPRGIGSGGGGAEGPARRGGRGGGERMEKW